MMHCRERYNLKNYREIGSNFLSHNKTTSKGSNNGKISMKYNTQTPENQDEINQKYLNPYTCQIDQQKHIGRPSHEQPRTMAKYGSNIVRNQTDIKSISIDKENKLAMVFLRLLFGMTGFGGNIFQL